MRRSTKALAAVLLVVSVPAVSFAATTPIVVWCNNCNSTAIDNAVLASGAGVGVPVYVGDPITGSYGAYDWFADVDDSHNPPLHVKYVETYPGDPNVLKGVNAYIQFYQVQPVGWHKTYNLVYNGGDPKATGWTVPNFGPTQTSFNNWLNNTSTIGGQAAQFFGIAAQLLGKIAQLPSQTETITFPDGSSIATTQNTICGCLNAYPDSARDAENNPIPYLDSNGKLHDAGGDRHYAATPQGELDYNAYLNQVKNFPLVLKLNGVQIGGGGVQGSGGGGVQPEICVETDNADGSKDTQCYAG